MSDSELWESIETFRDRGSAEGRGQQLQDADIPFKIETGAPEDGRKMHYQLLVPKSLAFRARWTITPAPSEEGLAWKSVRVVLGIASVSLVLAFAAWTTEPGALLSAPWSAVWRILVLFALFGVLVGAITMLDGRSTTAIGDYPIARTVLSAVALGGAVALMPFLIGSRFHPLWGIALAPVGALLGWFGWRWAGHIIRNI